MRNSNPIYRLRNKNIYPELSNNDVKTFFNTQKYKFPIAEANNIFFMDNFLIQNVESSTSLDDSILLKSSKTVLFKKNGNLHVQPIGIKLTLSTQPTRYTKLIYGQNFAINIPNTNLTIREDTNIVRQMKWISRRFNLNLTQHFYLSLIHI